MVVQKIDSFGKVGWATVTLAAFWLAWPVGLMLVAYLAGSGRLQAWRDEGGAPGTWFNLRGKPWPARTGGTAWSSTATPSGNQAFDEYRESTIRRLEDEQKEFQAYLERLRKARDKAEFDAFMSERRQRHGGMDTTETAPGT